MTDPVLHRIWRRIDRERLADLTTEAIDRYTPSFAEEAATAIFADALKRARVPFRRQPVPAPFTSGRRQARANLIVDLGPSPPALMWLGHVDTTELSPEQEPGARREGDRIWGLGACDMKGACAAIVEVLAALREAEVELQRGLQVALVVGEEETGDGAEELVRSAQATLGVVGEPTGLAPCLAHYGYLECRLTTRGRRAHAALPEMGDNAVHGMLDWIAEIFNSVRRQEGPEQMVISLREIAGGSRNFVVADSSRAILDVHLAPDAAWSAARELATAAAAAVQPGHPGCRFGFKELDRAPGYALDRKDPRLEPLRRAWRHRGRAFRPQVFRSHSDASRLFSAGIPAVVVGPGELAVAHTPGEHVELGELVDAARLYAAIIHESCVRPTAAAGDA